MLLQRVAAGPDDELVDRYGGQVYRRLAAECNMICGPYTALLGRKVRTQSEDQIFISFSDRFEPRGDDDPFFPLPMRWPFDIERYIREDEHVRHLRVLRSVQAVCDWCVKTLRWSNEPFEEAYRALMAVNCKWTYVMKKPIPSPNKSLRVQLLMQLDAGEFTLLADLLPPRSRKAISRIEVGKFHAQYANDYGDFPKLTWLSPDQFSVCGHVVNVVTKEVKGGKKGCKNSDQDA